MVDVDVLEAGYCSQIERITNINGKAKFIKFPSLFALIRHPTHGACLFDTGYSTHFIEQTRCLPESLYRLAVPVNISPSDNAKVQLAEKFGIDAKDVKYIFISHFHGDHYGGLLDFPNAKFIYPHESYEHVRHKSRIKSTCCAFVKGLIPSDFDQRSKPLYFKENAKDLPLAFKPFNRGIDVFEDGTMWAIPLPGHTIGHMGLLLRGHEGITNDWVFMVGDACWSSEAYRKRSPPSQITRHIHSGGWKTYLDTLNKLYDLHTSRPDIRIVPSHCSEIYNLCIVNKKPIWPTRTNVPQVLIRNIVMSSVDVKDAAITAELDILQQKKPKTNKNHNKAKVLVFGATGFLGQYLCHRLHDLGFYVIGSGRNAAIGEQLTDYGIHFEPCDIRNTSKVISLCCDNEIDIVYHTAAKCSPWGTWASFYEANVDGTRNIVKACQKSQVKRLIYVSTPSVYFNSNPGHRMNVKETGFQMSSSFAPTTSNNSYDSNNNDDIDYCISTSRRVLPRINALPSYYARTKREAEHVIDEASLAGLPVISIRPRGIIGVGDTTILPRLLIRLKRGRLPIIGNGDNIIDMTQVENVVEALVLCLKAPSSCLGKSYNITDGEPQSLTDIYSKSSKSIGVPAPSIHIPFALAWIIGWVFEIIFYILLAVFGLDIEPPLTRYSVNLLGRTSTLDITSARRELNYKPVITFDEGLDKILNSLKQ